MWQNLRIKSGMGLMLAISLGAGCSDSSAVNNRDWDLQDPKDSGGNGVDVSEDSGSDASVSEKDFDEGDCVHEGLRRIQTQAQVDELKNIKCRTLEGGITLWLNENVKSIESLGSLKVIRGGISFGLPTEYDNYSNEGLVNIEGFSQLEVIEGGLDFYDAPGVGSLKDFEGLKKLGGVNVYHDVGYGDIVGFRCDEVERLITVLGEAYEGDDYCEDTEW